jgi:SnoaL-like protein
MSGRCAVRETRHQRAYCFDMATMLERLDDAMNAHDARRVASLCAVDYRSAQPLHPNRGFGGSAQVLENWSSVFDGVPDFRSELIASSQDGELEWGEWYWHGHHVDGSPFAMRGATIFVVRDGLIAEGRLYMEPVEADGGEIQAAVQELYKPPPGPPH